jgi:hypothetical protein
MQNKLKELCKKHKINCFFKNVEGDFFCNLYDKNITIRWELIQKDQDIVVKSNLLNLSKDSKRFGKNQKAIFNEQIKPIIENNLTNCVVIIQNPNEHDRIDVYENGDASKNIAIHAKKFARFKFEKKQKTKRNKEKEPKLSIEKSEKGSYIIKHCPKKFKPFVRAKWDVKQELEDFIELNPNESITSEKDIRKELKKLKNGKPPIIIKFKEK